MNKEQTACCSKQNEFNIITLAFWDFSSCTPSNTRCYSRKADEQMWISKFLYTKIFNFYFQLYCITTITLLHSRWFFLRETCRKAVFLRIKFHKVTWDFLAIPTSKYYFWSWMCRSKWWIHNLKTRKVTKGLTKNLHLINSRLWLFHFVTKCLHI